MHTICRFDFMQRLAAFMYANKSYHQQGFNTIDEVGEDLLGVMKDMEDAKRVRQLERVFFLGGDD